MKRNGQNIRSEEGWWPSVKVILRGFYRRRAGFMEEASSQEPNGHDVHHPPSHRARSQENKEDLTQLQTAPSVRTDLCQKEEALGCWRTFGELIS